MFPHSLFVISTLFSKIYLHFQCLSLFQDLTPEVKQKLLDMHNACVAESGVSADLVKGAMTGNFPNDPTLKEDFYCMSKKIGIQNENGQLQTDTIASLVSKYVTDPTIADNVMKCAIEQGTPQDTAYEFAKCAYAFKFGLA